jgi:sugar/nucleoside kinase (ribokinase family)
MKPGHAKHHDGIENKFHRIKHRTPQRLVDQPGQRSPIAASSCLAIFAFVLVRINNLLQTGAVTYTGLIGKGDKFGETLKKATAADSLTTLYKEVDGVPTGTCAVLLNSGERSLIANLTASKKYAIEWTQTAEVQAVVTDAGMYYMAGFVLTH